MAATLSSDMDNTDKVVGFLDEARNLNLKVLRPNINHSAYMFEATHADTIQYGLGAIKGVGQSVCEAIVKERLHYGPYTSLLDFCTGHLSQTQPTCTRSNDPCWRTGRAR